MSNASNLLALFDIAVILGNSPYLTPTHPAPAKETCTHVCYLFCDADAVGLSSARLPPLPSTPHTDWQELEDWSSCSGLDPSEWLHWSIFGCFKALFFECFEATIWCTAFPQWMLAWNNSEHFTPTVNGHFEAFLVTSKHWFLNALKEPFSALHSHGKCLLGRILNTSLAQWMVSSQHFWLLWSIISWKLTSNHSMHFTPTRNGCLEAF